MNELMKRLISERSQLEDHILHNELHQYIEDNADDLHTLLSHVINHLSKGEDKHAA